MVQRCLVLDFTRCEGQSGFEGTYDYVRGRRCKLLVMREAAPPRSTRSCGGLVVVRCIVLAFAVDSGAM